MGDKSQISNNVVNIPPRLDTDASAAPAKWRRERYRAMAAELILAKSSPCGILARRARRPNVSTARKYRSPYLARGVRPPSLPPIPVAQSCPCACQSAGSQEIVRHRHSDEEPTIRD